MPNKPARKRRQEFGLDLIQPTRNLGGRPLKLEPDKATLEMVFGLGRLNCTGPECAAMLRVTEPTWIAFKDRHEIVRETFDKGRGMGKMSLRRTLYRQADRGSAAAAIFLAKNELDMKDTFTPTSPTGGPFEIIHRLMSAFDGQTRGLPQQQLLPPPAEPPTIDGTAVVIPSPPTHAPAQRIPEPSPAKRLEPLKPIGAKR